MITSSTPETDVLAWRMGGLAGAGIVIGAADCCYTAALDVCECCCMTWLLGLVFSFNI